MSVAKERLFLLQAAQWKSAIPIYRESNLLTMLVKFAPSVSCLPVYNKTLVIRIVK